MKTFAKIGLGLLTFGFVIAVLGAIVIRTSAPRPPAEGKASATTSAVASSLPQTTASASAADLSGASAALQNSEKLKK